MKKITFAIMAIFIAVSLNAQTTIENPKSGLRTVTNLQINKVEINDTATVLYFVYNAKFGSKFSIPKKTYIKVVGESDKLYVTSSEGVPITGWNKMPKKGEMEYKLFFPPVDSSVSVIDFGEGNRGGSWYIYDIQVKPHLFSCKLPQEFIGNWYNEANSDWEISFFDTTAYYKMQKWQYGNINLTESNGTIELVNQDKKIMLHVKTGSKGTFQIGESSDQLYVISKDLLKAKKTEDTTTYKNIANNADSATLSGYIYGYSSRMKKNKGQVNVKNILNREIDEYPFELSDDGYFSVKIPIEYQQYVRFSCKFYGKEIFMEPGKEVFFMYNRSYKPSICYSGDGARLNNDLNKINNIHNFDNNYVRENIFDLSPDEYKKYCLKILKKDLKELESKNKKYQLSAKAYQIGKLDIMYENAINLIDYKRLLDNANYKKNKKSGKATIMYDRIDIPVEYYKFINNDLVNNPVSFLSDSYGEFINRAANFNSRIIFKHRERSSFLDFINMLKESGYEFKPDEIKLIDSLEILNYHKIEDEYRKMWLTYRSKFQEMRNKYRDTIGKENYKRVYDKSGFSFIKLNEIFSELNIDLTQEEKLFMDTLINKENEDFYVKWKEINMQYGDAIKIFRKEHMDFYRVNSQFSKITARNELLKNEFGVNAGIGTDLMTAQYYCGKIDREMVPLSDFEIEKIKELIVNPDIFKQIEIDNQKIKDKIESNKYKTGYSINETPKTIADSLFDKIIEKYKGKLIYVDFWATWCGPCLSGMKRIKPLKEEMANKDVAFVYITSPSSKENAWKNIIPDIKGDHYRVTKDEWNYLTSKFNIRGIPHYVLVGKNGEVINPKLRVHGNDALKEILEKHLKD